MPVRYADGSLAVHSSTSLAEAPTGAPSSAYNVDFLDKLKEAEDRDYLRNKQEFVYCPPPSSNRLQSLLKPSSRQPSPKAAPQLKAPVQQLQSPGPSRSGSPRVTSNRLSSATRGGPASKALAGKKLSLGQVVSAASAKQDLQHKLKAKAAAQRGGKRIAAAAADPSRSLPSLGYAVLGPIAAGAFSTILRCRSTAGGELVAVKSFDNLKCAKDRDVGDARDRELGVLRALRQHSDGGADDLSGADGGSFHPHIANMLAELGDNSSPHVHAVLQFAEGGSLKRYLDALAIYRKGARDDAAREGMPHRVVRVGVRQLASALSHMHALGMCHRDVKPANVLLAADSGWDAEKGRVSENEIHLRLCDFGFATVCHDELQFREFCTPQYAAPEIASPADAHRGYLGKPVDMWALGCVAYEMLHRKPAFKAEERFELEGLIRNCNFQPFSKWIKVPPDAKALIRGLLVPLERRLTAEQCLQESPWLSEEARRVRDAERELEKQRAAEEEERQERLRKGQTFGL